MAKQVVTTLKMVPLFEAVSRPERRSSTTPTSAGRLIPQEWYERSVREVQAIRETTWRRNSDALEVATPPADPEHGSPGSAAATRATA